ncbi:uncharacterized protein [Nicotiana sylvestris]|uniref:uncharacterized protein n=1 Tax=Nicotiana sylvestris TaxID=4096 RepID=UPI00388C9462
MHWGLRYILQGIKPGIFEELATRAHNMEVSMASAGNERLPIYEPRKVNDKQEVRKWGKFVPKSEIKESMNVNTSLVKFTTKESKKQSMKSTSFQDTPSGKLTLKEMQEKETWYSHELLESRVMIQGFNQWGQRAICVIRLGITIEDIQSSAWLHVIDAKTSYNVLLGRPWIHENKVVPCTYHQCLKYYEGEVEKTVVADDKPFTEAESHFADAKFYLKNRIVKELKVDDGTKSKNDEPITKRVDVTIGKAKTVTEEVPANMSKSHKGGIASYGKKVSPALQYVPKRKKDEGGSHNLQTKKLRELTLPVKRIEAVKLSSKLLARFVAQNRLQNVALPTKRTYDGFDPNAYKLFAKTGYNPNEPTKLGKLPSEATTRQPREGLGYKQPSPVRISIRRVSSNYITVEDESAASNRPSVFDRLGKSTVSSIVHVRKKNGQIRVCIDFKDLNNACPKDEFPLPIPELMIDATTGYEAMSFMDGSSGYNQIRMAPKDEELTAFRTPKGIYCYKSLQGELTYLRRFISNLVGRCQPFSHLMKKGVPFKWDQACSNAFESIKTNLMKPPVLAAHIPGKPLILYIAAQERSVGALLAQENSEGKENSLYYLSRMMIPNELNYSPIEMLCLALVFSIQKLKHYFQAHVVRFVSKANPIKFVMSKPVLSDLLLRWYLQFQQFEILYIPQKAVKGQALADFLANHLVPDD